MGFSLMKGASLLMKTKTTVCIIVALLLYVGTPSAAYWATSEGSCYGQWNKNISFGMSLLHFGFFGAFDLGIHDMVGECALCHYHDVEEDSEIIDYKPKCEECVLYEEDIEERNKMMWPCSRHFVEWHESNDRESALKLYSIIQKELDEQDVEELL